MGMNVYRMCTCIYEYALVVFLLVPLHFYVYMYIRFGEFRMCEICVLHSRGFATPGTDLCFLSWLISPEF